MSVSNLIIVSAGKFAREVYTWAQQAIDAGTPWVIKGFLDDRADALRGFNYPAPILGSVENYEPKAGDLFLAAIGEPAPRRHYCMMLEAKGAPPVHRRPAIQEPGRIPVRTPEPTAPVRRTPRTPDEPEPARIRVQHIALEDEEGDSMDRATLKGILADVLDEALGLSDAPMHPKFRGGKVLVQPGNAELKPHELDIEVLFKKVVMVRDRLRVLEQKINAQDKLTADEKAQMQVYITGCYGSLTSFNYLFRERDDWFVGQAER